MASMANAAGNAFGAQLAYPGRQTIELCGDGGFTMLGPGDLLTQVQRKTKVLHIIFNNEPLNFVGIDSRKPASCPSAWISRTRILPRSLTPWEPKA
jgi:pyruvate dehydrogenase (quinone)